MIPLPISECRENIIPTISVFTELRMRKHKLPGLKMIERQNIAWLDEEGPQEYLLKLMAIELFE